MNEINTKKKIEAWVVTVDMGLGHQRAAYPLRHIAHEGILNANNYAGIPASDRKIWQNSRRFYEFISRFKHVPFIGNPLFELYDKLQSIEPYYPKRDLSNPTIQVREIMSLIERSKWGKHLIEKLSKNPLPIICSFFVPAFMAEYFNYPGDIYCLATDTDISRAWVPEFPARSRIRYFAPTYRVADRLRLYGVNPNNIFLTGFPLPMENIGTTTMKTLKRDLRHRLRNLDPRKQYWKEYGPGVSKNIGYASLPQHTMHPLSLMFAVGGAGAQRELGITILRSLKDKIREHEISLTLVAGVHREANAYFRESIMSMGLHRELGRHITILYEDTKDAYFKAFNHALRTTDILWSKPSELAFYTALGIPLIIAPPIGSQERFNKKWVETIGSGTYQEDPVYTHEWLFDWLDSGWLAEAAMEGFVEAPKLGTYNIEKIIADKVTQVHQLSSSLLY